MGTKGGKSAMRARQGASLRGWLGLAAGLVLLWATAYVILPWSNNLPCIQPIMRAIDAADIDASAYWYTQSEQTARAQMFVRNAIRKHE